MREAIATTIAFLVFETTLLISLAVVYFTTAISISVFALIISYFLAEKWLDYVFPRKQN